MRRRRNDIHVGITLVGGSRNYPGIIVRGWRSGSYLQKNLTFFSLTILQRGPISRKTILFKVPEGGGGSFIQGRSNFFLEGVGSVCLFQWKPVELALCSHGSENAINNCVSTSPKCTDVVEALTRLL